MIGQQHWVRRAQCRDQRVEMVPDSDTGHEVLVAKVRCFPCPVSRDCAAVAAAWRQEHGWTLQGVWGGLTAAERDRADEGLPVRPECLVCGMPFVGPRAADRCDTCDGNPQQWVIKLEEEVRRLLFADVPAARTARMLGLDEATLSEWIRQHLSAYRQRRVLTEPPPSGPPVCGSQAAKAAHIRQRRKAGLSGSLKDLTCACRTNPPGPAASRKRLRRKNNTETTLD